MAEHPAAPLLAADFGRLPHTNKLGEKGFVQLPGFGTAGMSKDQADATGAAGLAIAEAIIEDLQDHGYPVLSKADIKARIDAAAQGTPPPSDISLLCNRCRHPVLGVKGVDQAKIHVGTAVALLQAHMEACR